MISIIVFCLIVDLAEITSFAAGHLRPLPHLLLQIVKTTIWFVLFMLSVVNLSKWQVAAEYGGQLVILPMLETLVPL